jgi:hypothetical protein
VIAAVLRLQGFPETNEMAGKGARPDDVDLKDINLRRTRSEKRRVQCEALVGICRRRHKLDGVSGRSRPGLGARAAELLFDAERRAGYRHLDLRTRCRTETDRREKRQARRHDEPSSAEVSDHRKILTRPDPHRCSVRAVRGLNAAMPPSAPSRAVDGRPCRIRTAHRQPA